MKVLHVHYTDWIARSGGGVVAMSRLHHGLQRAHIESRIMAKISRPECADSVGMPSVRSLSVVEKCIGRITVPLGFNDIHCVSAFGLDRARAFQEADILNFHGLQGGYFSYLALPRLTKSKMGVLTLHDMWPFTGHCAYNYDCDRWKTGCGKCPHLDTSPAVCRDSTRWEWKLKNWVYSRSNLAVVTLSRRRTQQARESMLDRFPIYEIPNGIDVSLFRRLNTRDCRSLLGLDPDKKVLLYAAAKLSQRNKGPDLLIRALNSMPASIKSNLVLLTLGDRGEALRKSLEVESRDLGYVSADAFKVIAYSAADLFVYPTRAESLPLVVQESMACGTPAVSFDVGGVPDLVRHGETGYLAPIENLDAFQSGIVELLENDHLREAMSQRCREMIVNEYSLDLQVQRYVALYEQLLGIKSEISSTVRPVTTELPSVVEG